MSIQFKRTLGILICTCLAVVPAGASHPEKEKPRNADLAAQTHQLERSADRLWEIYQDDHYGRGRAIRRLAQNLQGLRRSATKLHRSVEEHPRDLTRADQLFHRTEQALGGVEDSVQRVRHMSRDFERALDKVAKRADEVGSNLRRIAKAREERERISVLAHKIENRTDHLYDRASHELNVFCGFDFSDRSDRTLDRLDDLKDSARRFHAEVERRRGRRDAEEIRESYARLVAKYERAGKRIRNLSRDAQAEFYDIGRAIEKVGEFCDLDGPEFILHRTDSRRDAGDRDIRRTQDRPRSPMEIHATRLPQLIRENIRVVFDGRIRL